MTTEAIGLIGMGLWVMAVVAYIRDRKR